VTEAIEYEQFDQAAQSNEVSASEADLSRLSEIPMELSVEIGRTHMTVGETLDLRIGSVVTLERLAGEPVDLLVNGTAIARGEVVVVDEQYGLRVTEILDTQQDSDLPRAASSAEATAAQEGSVEAVSADPEEV
jgi:flagellar motor switch protein FliN